MSATEEQILNLVKEIVRELNEDWGNDALENPGLNTVLYGSGGQLDSLDLVNLVSEVEDRVEEDFDLEISLADERAMAEEVPPFQSIKTLVKYICMLLSEA